MNNFMVVANWKLYGTNTQAVKLIQAIRHLTKKPRAQVEVVLAPPFTTLATVQRLIENSRFGLAAQNVFWEEQGAFTGEVSPAMLLEAGCRRVLVGHSERRRLFLETNRNIQQKLAACLSVSLAPILCIGETLQERRKGQTRQVLSRQISSALKGVPESAKNLLTIAYEPVWAIGTGRKATTAQINEAHGWIRRSLNQRFGPTASTRIHILYGGSVNPTNASELAAIPEVDGALVGGASLEAESFVAIIDAFEEQGRRST